MKYRKVNHVGLNKRKKVNDLVKEMELSGVMGGGKIGNAASIIEQMIKDKDCKVFLGIAGAMVPGGMKKIIVDFIKKGHVDVLVSTGANLTHDLIEALGYKHYQGCLRIDDKKLNEEGIDRIYDCFMKNEVYIGLEDFFNKIFDKLPKKMSIKEFLYELGKRVKNKDSILRVCYEKNIPLFCPGISDSGIGMMIYNNLVKNKKIDVDAFQDLKDINEISWTAKKIGVIYVGGGVPKNFIQQSIQFSKNGADYAVQITMDRPEPGGSSGAELREGISWGKLNYKAKHVNVICDATIALPLIMNAVIDRI